MNLEGMGDFDEDNIIVGKRRRKAVDYRKLNDSMFGDLSKEGAEKVLGEAGKGAESWSPAVARKRKKEEEEEEGGGGGGEEAPKEVEKRATTKKTGKKLCEI